MVKNSCIYIFVTCCYTFVMKCQSEHQFNRGLGDLEWQTFEDGLRIAKDSRKPLMLIIHKSWCGACQAFKPKFAKSAKIKALCQDFVMVNTEDDEEPTNPEYSPDGGYIPRILFLNPDGEVMRDAFNENGNPNYKYYYSDMDSVVVTMKKVVRRLSSHRLQDEL